MAISCDPSALVKAAKCFECIPRGSRRWVKNYLLCLLANSGQMTGPTATGLIANTQTSTLIRLKWDTLPAGVTATNVYTSTDGVNFALVSTVNAPITVTNITDNAVVGQIQYIKIQWCVGSGCGAFSNVARIPGSVADWAARVITNGGAAPSSSTLTFLDTFWLSLNDNGLVSQMIAVMPIVPDNLIAALTPLIKTAGNDPWTNSGGNFVGGDLTINGLTGNAGNKVLGTGIIATAVFQNSANSAVAGTTCGLSVYAFTVGTVASGFDVGAASNSPSGEMSISSLFTPTSANQTAFDAFNNSTGHLAFNNAGWKGFSSGNRTSGTAIALYIASSTQAFTQVASNNNSVIGNAMPTVQFAGMGYNSQTNVLTGNTDRTISFIAIHTGLTSAQAQNLFNAVQALRVAMGGGFV